MIEAEFIREWSPLAVDRLYAQCKYGYYQHTLFYRVKPGFVAQFGGDDVVKIKQWAGVSLPDEPVLKPNVRGTISFARSGKETRGSDLFINLSNNSPRLDTLHFSGVQGFPVLGWVTKGMQVADSLYSGYGDRVFEKYDTLLAHKSSFLQSFPKLDSLLKVKVVKSSNKTQANSNQ